MRIIVADVNAPFAIHLLCQAFLANMTGPEYAWILPGYRNNLWWLKVVVEQTDDKQLACDSEQVLLALDGHFRVEFARLRHDTNVTTISGQVSKYVTSKISSK